MHFLYILISEQFNGIRSLNNTVFIMYFHHFYYWFGHLSRHLNGHNNVFSTMLLIRLRIPILSTYSRCSEKKCLILIRPSYSSVQFIFVSISHIFSFIDCYGVYLDLIGYTKIQCLLRFYFILYEIKINF